MTGIRHTDVKDFRGKSCLSTPSHFVTAPCQGAPPPSFPLAGGPVAGPRPAP